MTCGPSSTTEGEPPEATASIQLRPCFQERLGYDETLDVMAKTLTGQQIRLAKLGKPRTSMPARIPRRPMG